MIWTVKGRYDKGSYVEDFGTGVHNYCRSKHIFSAFGPFDQPACFGAGCYIEMVHSYHQPSENVLVRGENGFSAKNGPQPGRL